jgi:hypothetical protein
VQIPVRGRQPLHKVNSDGTHMFGRMVRFCIILLRGALSGQDRRMRASLAMAPTWVAAGVQGVFRTLGWGAWSMIREHIGWQRALLTGVIFGAVIRIHGASDRAGETTKAPESGASNRVRGGT